MSLTPRRKPKKMLRDIRLATDLFRELIMDIAVSIFVSLDRGNAGCNEILHETFTEADLIEWAKTHLVGKYRDYTVDSVSVENIVPI